MKGRPLIVLDVVGLTPRLLGPETPNLSALARQGSAMPLQCPFPALTLPSQATLLTGAPPSVHGIVGNGWYSRELAEPQFWKQPHGLLQAEDVLARLRRERPGFRVAKLFLWFNMYAPVDFAATPRPMYPADGRKIPDIHTYPAALRDDLQRRFGTFPLFRFWGPAAGLESTAWIAKASLAVIREQRPDLSLVYLPHLDYDMQRFGPGDPRSRTALREVDGIAGEFLDLARSIEGDVLVFSEYGISEVRRPVHPNRALRREGMLALRIEEGTERLDCGASRAFALADHQIAHVIVRDPSDRDAAAAILSREPGVDRVLAGDDLVRAGLAHPRAGDLVAVSDPDAWFTYYFWEDDRLAPDYARTVDIHRKPGYDPAELFFDPALRFPGLRIARRLLGRRFGMRNLLDVIGLDASLVRGSHGRLPASPQDGPVLISPRPLPGDPDADCFPWSRVPQLIADLSPGGAG